ncbi:fibroblast growth factor receptor 4-like isoform X1 [Halichondria panicea]|uniref:fibroblast growth factor receptor 4-like isoform X1 n=1 Tax=Halichondria panicea TaxID=6063 RepID=UPI00312BA2D3
MAGLMTIASSRSYLNLTILALFWMLQSRCTCAVDVRELASSIVSAVCEASDSDVQEFYTSLSSSYASSQDQQYPDPQLDPTLDSVANPKRISQRSGESDIVPYYHNFFLDIYSHNDELQEEYFEWCVHLLSPDNDTIYGCIKGNETRGSDRFRLLGLFNVFSYHHSFKSTIILAIEDFAYTHVLQKALLVCTVNVPWLNDTIGVFYSLEIESDTKPILHKITRFPHQRDGFLVASEPKLVSTDTYAISRDTRKASWFHDNEYVQKVVNVDDTTDCVNVGGNFQHCSNITFPITYYVRDFSFEEISSCNFVSDFQIEQQTHFLSFNSPSINDTGEFKFAMFNGSASDQTFILERSFFIYVVFTVFPRQITLHLGSTSTVSCALKAPSNSTVYWLYKNQPIVSNCKGTEEHIRTESLENEFSMFYSDLKLCNTTVSDGGEYTCAVNYRIPIGQQLFTAQVHVTATVASPDVPKIITTGPPKPVAVYVGGAVAAVIIVILVIIFLAVALAILMQRTVKRRRRRTLRHRPSNHLLLKPQLVKDNAYVNLCSPDIVKTGELDFPRQKLELQCELGKGKFGKVFQAKAHGMVSSLPHVNIVAVKTTLNNESFGENYRLLNVLQMLKKLYRQPHKNICNILGHCTETKPLFLILEYACHGNLKEYLLSCRKAILSCGQELLIDRSPESVQSEGTSELNQLQIVSPATNPLHIELGALSDELKDQEKALNQTGSVSMAPGLIKETQFCNFAGQIANGLAYLANMNVVHCDLAARNILIAEKGELKITDFGMAKELTEAETPYQILNANDNDVFPVRWAAPELLDRHPNTFRSDIWSFGVTLWEIASYGSEPFSDIQLGASLELFHRHLQDGNRLPRPTGLSNYLYRQMCSCWSINPEARPCAEELVEYFQNIDPNTTILEDMLEEGTL